MNIGTEYDVDYGYDAYGRSSTVTSGSDTFTFAYLANSNLVSGITYPSSITVANSFETHRNLITSVENKFDTTTISKYDYSYDTIGRRSDVDWSGTAFSQTDTIAYAYNDRSEVTGADATNNANYEYGFAFDPIGNRLTSASKETGSTVSTSYASNVLNQYSSVSIGDPPSVSNPTYDFDGNMTSMPVGTSQWALTWDAENRLISAVKDENTKLEFAYDYMSRRVFKKVYSWDTDHWSLTSDLRFVYDGYLQIEELNGANSNAILKKNVWSSALAGLGSERLLSATVSGIAYYATTDANKNITDYLDASGTVKAHYELSPFGKTVNATGAMSGNFNYRFSSEYLDVETGLVYYNHRYYSPELGRWLSRDPIEEEGGWNLYVMCLNDSTNRVDIRGESAILIAAAAILVYSGASWLTGILSALDVPDSCRNPDRVSEWQHCTAHCVQAKYYGAGPALATAVLSELIPLIIGENGITGSSHWVSFEANFVGLAKGLFKHRIMLLIPDWTQSCASDCEKTYCCPPTK